MWEMTNGARTNTRNHSVYMEHPQHLLVACLWRAKSKVRVETTLIPRAARQLYSSIWLEKHPARPFGHETLSGTLTLDLEAEHLTSSEWRTNDERK
jgi:hypothetical protein